MYQPSNIARRGHAYKYFIKFKKYRGPGKRHRKESEEEMSLQKKSAVWCSSHKTTRTPDVAFATYYIPQNLSSAYTYNGPPQDHRIGTSSSSHSELHFRRQPCVTECHTLKNSHTCKVKTIKRNAQNKILTSMPSALQNFCMTPIWLW